VTVDDQGSLRAALLRSIVIRPSSYHVNTSKRTSGLFQEPHHHPEDEKRQEHYAQQIANPLAPFSVPHLDEAATHGDEAEDQQGIEDAKDQNPSLDASCKPGGGIRRGLEDQGRYYNQ
jgi:hypothetical protein